MSDIKTTYDFFGDWVLSKLKGKYYFGYVDLDKVKSITTNTSSQMMSRIRSIINQYSLKKTKKKLRKSPLCKR